MLERVTVTLPTDLLEDIDQLERNRSRFIQEAVRREVERRHREELRRSLQNPHGEVREAEALGFEAWTRAMPPDQGPDLVDPSGGTAVRWVPGDGWTVRDEAPPRSRRK